MAKIRQPYDEVRYVPWLDRDVAPGEVVTVPDVDLASYLEAGWEPADTSTKAAGRKLAQAGTITVLAGHTIVVHDDGRREVVAASTGDAGEAEAAPAEVEES